LDNRLGHGNRSNPHKVEAHLDDELPQPSKVGYLLAWILVGRFALAGNWITYKTAPKAAVPGGTAIVVSVLPACYGLRMLSSCKIPAVVYAIDLPLR